MVLPHYEEWRLSFVLPADGVKTGALMEQLRKRLPVDVDAHRKGRRGIRLYAQSHESIANAETIAFGHAAVARASVHARADALESR